MSKHDPAGDQHQHEHSQGQEDRRPTCRQRETDSPHRRRNDEDPEHRPLSHARVDRSGLNNCLFAVPNPKTARAGNDHQSSDERDAPAEVADVLQNSSRAHVAPDRGCEQHLVHPQPVRSEPPGVCESIDEDVTACTQQRAEHRYECGGTSGPEHSVGAELQPTQVGECCEDS